MFQKRPFIKLAIVLLISLLLMTLLAPEWSFRSVMTLYWKSRGIDIRESELSSYNYKYFEAGEENEQTLVLLHGLGALPLLTWLRILPELAKSYHVIAPRCLYGDIEYISGEKDYNLYQEVEQLRILLHEKDMRKVHLAGFSLGGWVGLLTCQRYPDVVSSLTLIDSPGIESSMDTLQELGNNRDMGAQELYRALFFDLPPVPEFVLEKNAREFWQHFDRVSSVIDRLERKNTLDQESLDKIRLPVQIIWGSEDRIVPFEIAKRLENMLPDARLHKVPRAAHAIVWDRPGECIRLIRGFIRNNTANATETDIKGVNR